MPGKDVSEESLDAAFGSHSCPPGSRPCSFTHEETTSYSYRS